MSDLNMNETKRDVINAEFVAGSEPMLCNNTDDTTGEFICDDITETMIMYKNLSYCSNCAKTIEEIVNANEKEKTEGKPIFMCPVKSCDTALTFKLFWTNSCCSAAIRKHSMGEVDALLKPAVEKLKKAEEELAKLDKLRREALKRKNEEKAEVAALEKWKVRILEKTVGARHLCCDESCKKEFGELHNESNKNIECVLGCGHSLCLECFEQRLEGSFPINNSCPICRTTFTKDTFIEVTSKNSYFDMD